MKNILKVVLALALVGVTTAQARYRENPEPDTGTCLVQTIEMQHTIRVPGGGAGPCGR